MRYILIIALLFNVASAQSLFGVVASDGFDADARRYLDSAGITNQTHRQALNNLVKGLKGNGLWSKMVAIYPMMGSTSSSMRWNLKDPRNLDAAYRISFIGSDWTFSATLGAQPNKSTGNSYANTFIPNNVTGSLANLSMGYYSFDNLNNRSTFVVEMGSRPTTSSATNQALMFIKFPNEAAVNPSQNQSGGALGTAVTMFSTANAVTDTRGLFTISRTSTTSLTLYQGSTTVVSSSSTETGTTGATTQIYLAALNDGGTPFGYSNRSCIFAFVGQGLSGSEVSTYNTLVENFRIAIGR